jgi:hypothetical protein
MNTQHRSSQPEPQTWASCPAQAIGATAHANPKARVIRHARPTAALLLVVAALAAGCGRHAIDQTTSAQGGSGVQQREGEPAVLASVTGADSSGGRNGDRESIEPRTSDSLPPAVDASAADSVVTPGAVVEIRALASEDVVDMGLSDGVGREQPFAYDSTMNVWHALYRVPIRNPKDRIGLAVTATNQGGHWRRVWVFLNLQP